MSRAPSSLDVSHRASIETDRDGKRTGRRSNVGLPLLSVWVIGFVASLGACITASEWDFENRREHFNRFANEEIREIRMEIQSAVASMHAIRGLFNASEVVDRDEFHAFVESLEVADPVQALAWVPRVPSSLRSEYEEKARMSGFSDFELTERESQGTMVRSEDRDEYFPVFFLEPNVGNEQALGFDLGSNAIRLAALNSARDSGREVATARITLVQDKGEQYGFLICVPIYRDGTTPNTAAKRKSELLGFSLGAFRTGDLVSAALSEGDSSYSPIGIHIFDRSAPTGAQLLYPKTSRFGDSNALLSSLREEAIVQVASRDWLIVATPTEGSVYTRESFVPWLILSLGLIITALTAMWFAAINSRNE